LNRRTTRLDDSSIVIRVDLRPRFRDAAESVFGGEQDAVSRRCSAVFT
jgi:hypothetical protein